MGMTRRTNFNDVMDGYDSYGLPDPSADASFDTIRAPADRPVMRAGKPVGELGPRRQQSPTTPYLDTLLGIPVGSASKTPMMDAALARGLTLSKQAVDPEQYRRLTGSAPMGTDFARNLGLDLKGTAGADETMYGSSANLGRRTQAATPSVGLTDLGGGAGQEDNASGVMRFAKGGPVKGPPGLDRVPATLPDGAPARLNAGEYVQPREEVIAYATQVLGDTAEGLSDDQLNAIGLKLLSQRTADVTGRAPGPVMAEPLPGQGQEPVPGMAGGSGGALDLYGDAVRQGAALVRDRLPKAPSSAMTPSQMQQLKSATEATAKAAEATTANSGTAANIGRDLMAKAGKVGTRVMRSPIGVGNPAMLATLVPKDMSEVRGALGMKPDYGPNNNAGPERVEWGGAGGDVPRVVEKATGKAMGPPATPAVTTPVPGGPQGAQLAERDAQLTKTMQRTPGGYGLDTLNEQPFLDQMAPQGATLTRQGKIFRYEDPLAMQPGREPQAPPRVIRGRGGVEIPRDNRPVVGGWLAGPASAGAIKREARAYDHLPISGVTYSDSAGGASLGQVRPVSTNNKAAEALRALYQEEAVGRAKSVAQQGGGGYDVLTALNTQPVLTEQDRRQQVDNRKQLDTQRQEQLVSQALAPKKGGGKDQADAGVSDTMKAVKDYYGETMTPTQMQLAPQWASRLAPMFPDATIRASVIARILSGIPEQVAVEEAINDQRSMFRSNKRNDERVAGLRELANLDMNSYLDEQAANLSQGRAVQPYVRQW